MVLRVYEVREQVVELHGTESCLRILVGDDIPRSVMNPYVYYHIRNIPYWTLP